MKFNKDEALKELETKIPNKGQTLNISKRTISEQLDKLIPLLANDETELNDFVSQVLPIFKSMDGNVKNDVSVGIRAYIESNPKDDSKKDDDDDDKKKSNPSEMEALLARITALEEEKQKNDRQNKISDVRKKIAEKMKELGVNNEKWIGDFLAKTKDIEDEEKVDEVAKEYTELYNKFVSSIEPSLTPGNPNYTGGADKYKENIISRAAELAKQSRLVENEK